MSTEGRYAYLWTRTKKIRDLGYTVRNIAVGTDK